MAALVLLIVALGQAAAPKGAARATDACALLANDDVKRILAVEVKERQPGTQQARGLLLSQCYFATGTPRSVSVAVAGAATSRGQTVTPRQFWQQQFHAEHAEPDKDAQETVARPVAGIGDEAFWSGTRVTGALYVLRGRTFIRVSVGGIPDERERIEKSRALAAAALKRLP